MFFGMKFLSESEGNVQIKKKERKLKKKGPSVDSPFLCLEGSFLPFCFSFAK